MGQKTREQIQRRSTDAQPGQPVPYREALAAALDALWVPGNEKLKLAAEKLRRDEANNAEIIDVLMRAGYTDIPAQVNAELIRRLLGYITPL